MKMMLRIDMKNMVWINFRDMTKRIAGCPINQLKTVAAQKE